MGLVKGRTLLIGVVVLADTLIGFLTINAGIGSYTVCSDALEPGSTSGCEEIGTYMDWGFIQAAGFALIATSLLCLGLYLVRGSRRWLAVTLALAASFVAVPAAIAAPAVFDDTGPVQVLPLFDR
jgi:hypothetical protein